MLQWLFQSKMIQRVRSYFRSHWRTSFLSIGAHSCFEIIDLLVPYAIGQIINVLSGRSPDAAAGWLINSMAALLGLPVNQGLSVAVLMGVIFAITVVRAPIEPWISGWFHWLITLNARRDRQAEAIAKILTLPIEFYDTNNPGRIANRIARGVENYLWSYPEVAGQLIPKLVRVLGIFIVMLTIDWRVALPFALSFAAVLGYSLRSLGNIVEKEKKLDRYMENTASHTSELVTNIKTVKAFATETREYERQRQRLSRELFVVTYGIHTDYVVLATRRNTGLQLASFGILALALYATVTGQISIGYFVTLMTLASMGYSEVQPISLQSELLARRFSPLQRFHEFMEEPVGLDAQDISFEDTGAPKAAIVPFRDAPQLPPSPQYQFRGQVEFRDLTFGYDRDRPVLNHINITLNPRETVALVGRSGSGKSTLVKLLFRYFDPDRGSITIDGRDIRALDTRGYRRRLAIVHQEVDVFNGTVLDNLRYGRPDASWEEVQQACAIARVDEFVRTLPDGYYTIVGERGLRLSGGQRQRLGIARALLVDPDVLVFDEATSSLDSESERAIQEAMGSILGTRTTLVIAHRLSTVRDADKIVVLDDGDIAEVGTHHQLLKQRGLYHRLHTLQSSSEAMPAL
ncbi:MAG: ABC transporter ATP-binding protein [Cyanobacteria bacterium P01_C01_bin.89]